MYKLVSFIAFAIFSLTASAQNKMDLDSIVHHFYQEGKPGIALCVIKDGQTIYRHTVGLASIEHNIEISDSTAFQLASVSKQFTAYLALLLEQEGKLRMEDDIRVYLPELKSLKHKITLTQLANHTHGLPNVTELGFLKGFGLADRMRHKDVVDIALNIQTFNFIPGEQYEYNNTGFVLLAEIIARASEMPFRAALSKYIFEPLNMTATSAIDDYDMLVKNKAESYAMTDHGFKRNDRNIMSNGSAGISSTITDLAKWGIHFQQNINVENSLFARMIEPSQLNDGRKIPYGLGLETKQYRGTKAVFHGGGDAGYRAYTLHFPEHKLSVFIQGNTNDYWPLALAYKISDYLLAGYLTDIPPLKKVQHTFEELKAYEGTYVFCPGNYFIFQAQKDTLFKLNFAQEGKVALPTIGDASFSFPFYPESKFIFNDNKVNFIIADFSYSCEKANPELKEYSTDELEKFIGLYRNDALNTAYELVIEKGQLLARHPINYDIQLYGLIDNSFFSRYAFFGKIDFKLNEEKSVTGFDLSGQNMKGLEFRKIE